MAPTPVGLVDNAQKDEGLRAEHIHDQGDLFVQVQLRIYRAIQEACERGG